jgi:prepilin-type N-terminal cleavage/methylation domain-containing protein
MSKHRAFTLAEVLIALSIIGVVAALTVPVLIKTYNEKVWETQAKKTYAEVASAWRLYISNNGGSPVGTYTNYVNLKNKFLVPYFKSTRDITFSVRQLNSIDGTDSSVGIILKNGVYIGVHNNGDSGSCNNNRCGLLYIDVNGSKPPNRVGYDAFMIPLTRNGATPMDPRYPATHDANNLCIEPEHTGWKSSFNDGYGCLNRILQNKPKWSG